MRAFIVVGLELASAGTLWQMLIFYYRAASECPVLSTYVPFVEFFSRSKLERRPDVVNLKMAEHQWRTFTKFKWEEGSWVLLFLSSVCGLLGISAQSGKWPHPFTGPALVANDRTLVWACVILALQCSVAWSLMRRWIGQNRKKFDVARLPR